MPHQPAPSSRGHSHRRSSGSWLEKKLWRIRNSKQTQKQLKQLLIIIAAVLIAFALGFYFFGPSFSSSGE